MLTTQDIEDLIWCAISESMDMDWTSRTGAMAVMAMLESEGLEIVPQGEVARLGAIIDEASRIADDMDRNLKASIARTFADTEGKPE